MPMLQNINYSLQLLPSSQAQKVITLLIESLESDFFKTIFSEILWMKNDTDIITVYSEVFWEDYTYTHIICKQFFLF